MDATLALSAVDLTERPRAGGPDGSTVAASLAARRSGDLAGFAQRCGLSADEAADAVQDVLVRLMHVLSTGVSVADPDAWAFRVVYRLAMDRHRALRRVGELSRRLVARPRPAIADSNDRIVVWAEVDRLPHQQRAVLYLHYRADLTFEQAAAVLDVTPGAARAYASRGIAALRSRLERE